MQCTLSLVCYLTFGQLPQSFLRMIFCILLALAGTVKLYITKIFLRQQQCILYVLLLLLSPF